MKKQDRKETERFIYREEGYRIERVFLPYSERGDLWNGTLNLL